MQEHLECPALTPRGGSFAHMHPEFCTGEAEGTCNWAFGPGLGFPTDVGFPTPQRNLLSAEILSQLLVNALCGTWVEVKLKLSRGGALRSVWLPGLKWRCRCVDSNTGRTWVHRFSGGLSKVTQLAELGSSPLLSGDTPISTTSPTANEAGNVSEEGLPGHVHHDHCVCLHPATGAADSCPLDASPYILSCSLLQITAKNVRRGFIL